MRSEPATSGGAEPHGSALFPTTAARARLDDLLTEQLASADLRMRAGPVSADFDAARFARELATFEFAEPRPIEDLLAWTIAGLEHGVVHVNHPRYFGLFNPAAAFPAQCADRIAASFNPQLASATTSPVPVAIEAHVVQAVARRSGLPGDAGGHFTTGGAEANFTALICALTRAEPHFAHGGARALSGDPVCYISADSHLAWLKIAHQAGIGREAMRLIGTDGRGRMDAAALALAVARDREAGRIPVMIVATAGTTAAGMIDPLAACADIAARFGIWFHVDAAWGGAMIATARGRDVLAGIERACSITIDAHKWFATTMGCGMFITRHASVLSDAFQVSTTYMPSNTPSLDPYVTSVQWSRRFLGLRLFLCLAACGWSGYGEHVERAIDLVALLRDLLIQRGWTIANDSPLAVLCAEPPPATCGPRSIVDAVVASGEAWVSVARFEGREVVRACVTHGQTSRDDVLRLVAALTAAL